MKFQHLMGTIAVSCFTIALLVGGHEQANASVSTNKKVSNVIAKSDPSQIQKVPQSLIKVKEDEILKSPEITTTPHVPAKIKAEKRKPKHGKSKPSTRQKAHQVKHKPVQSKKVKPVNSAAVDCLALVIWTESRGDHKSQAPNAITVLERIKRDKAKGLPPKTVCKKILEPNQYQGVSYNANYRYSVAKLKQGVRTKHLKQMDKNPNYLNAKTLAKQILAGNHPLQRQGFNATIFATPKAAKRKGWYSNSKMRYVGRYGGHVYFREI